MQINFVGDIMLGELLENYRSGVRTLIERGTDPFEFCRQQLSSAPWAVANLECVVSDVSDKEGFLRDILRAPKTFASVIKRSGINVVNLANNHSQDHGQGALNETLEVLAGQGIRVIGVEAGEPIQRQPLVIGEAGMRLGLLGYNLANFDRQRLRQSVEQICDRICAAVRTVDFLVLSMHWGEEYADYPKSDLCDLARRFFSLGAGLIHGHHSHRLQGIAIDKGKVFAPSLGNFIFDDRRMANRLTAILTAEIDEGGLRSAKVRPFYINRRFQPVPSPVLEGRLSGLNQKLEAVYQQSDPAIRHALDRSVERIVARGHAKNRLRMRWRMLLNAVRYRGNWRTLWHYQQKRSGTRFSVTDS